MTDDNVLEYAAKTQLLEIIRNSKLLKKKLTSEQIITMGAWVSGLSRKEVLSFFREQIGGQKQSMAHYVGAGAGGALAVKAMQGSTSANMVKMGTKFPKGKVGGAVAGMGLMYLYKKLSDPCVRAHIGNSVAQSECKIAAIRRIQQEIKVNMNQCSTSPNPVECRTKYYADYDMWESRIRELMARVPGE